MGYRRSYRKRRGTSIQEHFWACVGLVIFVLLFVLLNWLGIALVGILLALPLCIVLGLRYGQPGRLLHLRTGIAEDQPMSVMSGLRLPSAEVVRAQEKSRANTYYQSRTSSPSPHGQRRPGQPKDDQPKSGHPKDYEQAQTQYPEQQPPQ
jgi:hypothetical protein